MTPDKTNTRDAITLAVTDYATGGEDISLTVDRILAVLCPAPSPQARPMQIKAEAVGNGLNWSKLKIWKDGLLDSARDYTRGLAEEIAYRINHFEAPTPSETLTAPVGSNFRCKKKGCKANAWTPYADGWKCHYCGTPAHFEVPGTADPIGDRTDLVLERDQLRARVAELEGAEPPARPLDLRKKRMAIEQAVAAIRRRADEGIAGIHRPLALLDSIAAEMYPTEPPPLPDTLEAK